MTALRDGVLCIDKPEGWTSFDAVARARGISGCRSVGHGGTLDPMATGVLPLFFGRATKAVGLVPDTDKGYIAGFRLGLATDTQDVTGRELSRSDLLVGRAALETALSAFRGEILQRPPMVSAVRVGGKRLYDLARQGIEVERAPRPVTIRSLELTAYDEATRSGTLEISCTKGTYIRTLLDDLGRALGTGGVMTSLRRIAALGFTLADCVTMERMEELAVRGELDDAVLPVERLFGSYPALALDERLARLFVNGVRLSLTELPERPPADVPLRVCCGGRFLGLARADGPSRTLVLIKLFETNRK